MAGGAGTEGGLQTREPMRQKFYAVHHYEIIPCHYIGKSKKGNAVYKADSKRDKRRFTEVYQTLEEAREKSAQYERYMSQQDTF